MSDQPDMMVEARRTASALRLALAAGYAPLTPSDDEALRIWRMLKFSSEGEGKHIDRVPLEVVYRAMLAFAVPESILREAVCGITDDYMTSEEHHPGFVLIPVAKFDQLRAAAERLA